MFHKDVLVREMLIRSKLTPKDAQLKNYKLLHWLHMKYSLADLCLLYSIR